MKKELIKKFENKKENIANNLFSKDISSYYYKIQSMELENYNKLDGYAEFMYDFGLFLTDINEYRKEENISKKVSDVELEVKFANSHIIQKNYFDDILKDKITMNDLYIYDCLQSYRKYEKLATNLSMLQNLENYKDNIRIKVNFGKSIPPIKELEIYYNKDLRLSLSDLEILKLKVEKALKLLPQVKIMFENYSPVLFKNMINDENGSVVDKVFVGATSFDIKNNQRYTDLSTWAKNNYKLHKRLKSKAKYSNKAKNELFELTNEYIKVGNEMFKIIKEYIMLTYEKILPIFGNYFGTKVDIDYLNHNYEWYMNDIDLFIKKLENAIVTINVAINKINNEKEAVNNEISRILLEVKKETNIEFNSAEEIINCNLFNIYQNAHLHLLAKDMDRAAMEEIKKSYGKVDDELVYRRIPLK